MDYNYYNDFLASYQQVKSCPNWDVFHVSWCCWWVNVDTKASWNLHFKWLTDSLSSELLITSRHISCSLQLISIDYLGSDQQFSSKTLFGSVPVSKAVPSRIPSDLQSAQTKEQTQRVADYKSAYSKHVLVISIRIRKKPRRAFRAHSWLPQFIMGN